MPFFHFEHNERRKVLGLPDKSPFESKNNQEDKQNLRGSRKVCQQILGSLWKAITLSSVEQSDLSASGTCFTIPGMKSSLRLAQIQLCDWNCNNKSLWRIKLPYKKWRWQKISAKCKNISWQLILGVFFIFF